MKKKILSLMVLVIILSFAVTVPIHATNQYDSTDLNYKGGYWTQTVQPSGSEFEFRFQVASDDPVSFTIYYGNYYICNGYTIGGGSANQVYADVYFTHGPAAQPFTIYFSGSGYVSYGVYNWCVSIERHDYYDDSNPAKNDPLYVRIYE